MKLRANSKSLLGKRLVVALLLIVLALGPSIAAAQNLSPSVNLAGTSISVDGGETSTVTAEYQFEVTEAGNGNAALSSISSISGTIWQFPDRDISEINASVNGESVNANITEQSRHYNVSVPVEDISDGDTVTVTLEYRVAGPDGEIRTPLWVPEYSTSGEATVVNISMTLPEGTTVSEAAFPGPSSIDGNTATYELLHVPGFIKAEYGESGPGLITTDTLYSILGVVAIAGFIVGGLAIDRKTA